MNNRMVYTSISILRLLSHESMSTNDLIERTSSDKSFVVNTIKALNKAKIIKRTRSHEHRQKKINELEDLGSELVKIVYCIEQYSSAYKKFINTYRENFRTDEKRSLQHLEFSIDGTSKNRTKRPQRIRAQRIL